MYTPTRNESPPSCIRRSKRLILRTKPVSGITEPLSQFEAAVTSFENRYDTWVQARYRASIARGEQYEAEAALAEQLRGVGLAILTAARGRRRSEVYHRYFPEGYGATLKLSAQEALGTAAGLLSAMSDETIPDIIARREPLTTAQTGLENAMAARQAAVNTLGEARSALEEEKSVWRIAYTSFYFALRTIFPDRRQWVESLFKVNGRRQSDEVVPPEGQKAASGDAVAGTNETNAKAAGTGVSEAPTVQTGAQPASVSTPTNITPISSSAVTTTMTTTTAATPTTVTATAPEPVGSVLQTAEGDAAA